MNYTEDQLKAALVRALPDKIKGPWPTCGQMFWIDTNLEVTPHEWPAIVGMVEEGLTELQDRYNYGVTLAHLVLKEENAYFNEGEETEPNLNGFGFFALVTLPWPVRAQALADIGAITIL